MRLAMVVLTMLTLAASALALEPVAVKNASFEETAAQATGPLAEGWQTDGSPPGWHHWIGSVARTGKPILTWEKGEGRTGSRCVSLQACIGSVCVIQTVPCEPNGQYVVRAWGRTSNPKAGGHLSVRWQEKDGKWTGGTLICHFPDTSPPNTWQELEVFAHAPSNAGLLVVMLTATGQTDKDRCWFDDVSVGKFGPSDVVVSSCSWMHPNLWPVGEPPETPHVKWAKPWAGGKLKALFILGSDHSLREQVEIAQRLDLDYDFTFAHEFEQAFYALNNREIMRRLDERYYDVIVVALNAKAALCQALMDKLGPGKGLVAIASARVKPELPVSLRLSAAPTDHYLRLSLNALPPVDEKGVSGVQAIQVADGPPCRVVKLTYSQDFSCLTPRFTYEQFLTWGAGYWEGYLQTVMRAMLWAAGKAPQNPARMAATATGAELAIPAATGQKLTCRTWVTDRLNRQHGEKTVQADARMTIACPDDAASGPAMFSAILADAKGNVLDFASCLSEAKRDARLLRVRPTQECFLENEPVAVTVEAAGAVGGMKIETTLTDIHGREMAKAVSAAREGTDVISLKPRDRFSTLNWVEARLLQGDRERDAARWFVLAPVSRQRFLEDFQVGTWASTGYHPAYLHDAMVQTMKRAAITEGLENSNAYLATLAGGIWPVSTAYGGVPGFGRFEGPATTRKPCLSDPEVRARMAQKAEEVARKELGVRPIFGYLADETSLVKDDLDLDTCSSAHCQQRYRTWLRERYKSLDQLNAEWRTAYKSWDEVGWTDYREARKNGNLAPWVMYRRFMDWVWADAVKWSSENARKADPTALVALANSFGLNPFSGRDYWLLAAANDYTMEYPYECFTTSLPLHHFEAVRSFAGRRVHHPWIGYVFSDEAIHFDPWWCALHGASGVEIYGCMSLFAGKNSWAQIFPTMQLTKRGQMYADIVKPLTRGLGKALMTAKRPQADIAILWSQPSLYVAWGMSGREGHPTGLGKNNPYNQYFSSREAFRKAVIGSGRQLDYVCEEQIRSGVLNRYKCLVLPASFALGPDVCQRLDEFVKNGGLLIADQGAGLANEAGAYYEDSGPVCALFGIRRKERNLAYEDAQVSFAQHELKAAGHELLEPVEGAASYADGAPMAVAKPHGKGRTLFLNFAATDGAALRVLFDGLPVLAAITSEAGQRSPTDHEVVRLDRGDIQYLGVLHDYRNADEHYPLILRLPAKRHVYDALSGKSLGQTDRVPLAIAPGHAALFACLPYEVEGLALSGSVNAQAGQTCRLELTVKASAKPGDHVLHVAVTNPRGERAEAYCQNILTQAGRAVVEVPLAPNDPPGKWQVEVSEIASGKSARQVMDLKP